MACASGLWSVSDWVEVGDPGNEGTDLVENSTGAPVGGVDYTYYIARYETTNQQYAAFLNAVDPEGLNEKGLYNPRMGSTLQGGIDFVPANARGLKFQVKKGQGNQPVVYVSFWDAARYANWMGGGDTEFGVYDLSDLGAIANNSVTRDETAFHGGVSAAVTSVDEWIKAGFYAKGETVTNAFCEKTKKSLFFPTPITDPIAFIPPSGTLATEASGFFLANYGAEGTPTFTNLENVGSHEKTVSPYGTYNQAGNVSEWSDFPIENNRRIMGGSWFASDRFWDICLTAPEKLSPASSETNMTGFRVVGSAKLMLSLFGELPSPAEVEFSENCQVPMPSGPRPQDIVIKVVQPEKSFSDKGEPSPRKKTGPKRLKNPDPLYSPSEIPNG